MEAFEEYAGDVELIERARVVCYDDLIDWSVVEAAGRACRGQAKGVDAVVADYVSVNGGKEIRTLVGVDVAHEWLCIENELLSMERLPKIYPSKTQKGVEVWSQNLGEINFKDEEIRWRLWLCGWANGWEKATDLRSWLLRFIQQKVEAEIGREDTAMSNCITRKRMTKVVPMSIIFINTFVSFERKPYVLWGGSTSKLFVGAIPLEKSEHQFMTPRLIVQAAQQCLVRPPDRVIERFGLKRFETTLGFEV